MDGFPTFTDKVSADITRMPIDEVMDDMNEDEDLISPDDRRHMRLLDSRRQADGELSDSDDEGEGGRRDHASHREGENLVHPRRAAVGIMSTGSTHGIGTSIATAVNAGISTPVAGSSGQSDMDVDEEMPLAPHIGRNRPSGTATESANGTSGAQS